MRTVVQTLSGIQGKQREASPWAAGGGASGMPRPGGGRLACYEVHKSPRAYTIVRGGSVVEVSSKSLVPGRGRRGGRKGAITEWSMRSRRHCFKCVAMASWGRFKILFITLTYPGKEASEFVPSDGRVGKRDVAAFRKRLVRRFGVLGGMWKQEFQRRGAVHFHLWLAVPLDHPLAGDRLGIVSSEFQKWLAVAWYESVGSKSVNHLFAGTGSRWLDAGESPQRYIKGYLVKGKGKEYQNRVPDGFDHPGRFWGWFGGLGAEIQKVWIVPRRVAFRVRRVMHKLLELRVGHRWPKRRAVGCFVVVDDPVRWDSVVAGFDSS